jgi:hypothetical protein
VQKTLKKGLRIQKAGIEMPICDWQRCEVQKVKHEVQVLVIVQNLCSLQFLAAFR